MGPPCPLPALLSRCSPTIQQPAASCTCLLVPICVLAARRHPHKQQAKWEQAQQQQPPFLCLSFPRSSCNAYHQPTSCNKSTHTGRCILAFVAFLLAGRRHPHEQPAKRQQAQQQQPPFLWGVVRYEDSVEDEWFVVWLLLHLTQQLPGCTARCWDNDGEFLLIEVGQSCRRRGGLTVVGVGVGGCQFD